MADLQSFSGRTIDVPSRFIAGANDWGILQIPGNLEKMKPTACTQMLGVNFVGNAGHCLQQEQTAAVSDSLTEFYKYQGKRDFVSSLQLLVSISRKGGDAVNISQWPLDLTLGTAKPVSLVWKVTRSIKLVMSSWGD